MDTPAGSVVIGGDAVNDVLAAPRKWKTTPGRRSVIPLLGHDHARGPVACYRLKRFVISERYPVAFTPYQCTEQADDLSTSGQIFDTLSAK